MQVGVLEGSILLSPAFRNGVSIVHWWFMTQVLVLICGKSRHFKVDPICLFFAQQCADLQTGLNAQRDLVSKDASKNKPNERKANRNFRSGPGTFRVMLGYLRGVYHPNCKEKALRGVEYSVVLPAVWSNVHCLPSIRYCGL